MARRTAAATSAVSLDDHIDTGQTAVLDALSGGWTRQAADHLVTRPSIERASAVAQLVAEPMRSGGRCPAGDRRPDRAPTGARG